MVVRTSVREDGGAILLIDVKRLGKHLTNGLNCSNFAVELGE